MTIKLQFFLVFVIMLCASVIQARTEAEVFEKASSSVVAIKTYDAKGKGQILGSGVLLEVADGQQLNSAVPVERINELPKRNTPTSKTEKETSTGWLNRAFELEGKKDWPSLIEHTLRWTKARPRDATAWLSLGNAYRESGQINKAIEAYQQAIRIDPEYANAWYDLGMAYKYSGQTSQVMDVYKRLKTLDPTLADQFYNKVVLF